MKERQQLPEAVFGTVAKDIGSELPEIPKLQAAIAWELEETLTHLRLLQERLKTVLMSILETGNKERD
ncbi:hypothetical protein LCGC14_2453300 [marine sediment metagenome]|uniref:Type I restriction modification DNA specificity domain-containing protein n=1 Tax=marine sediment metagenome TaxID=412755 RepID=A0A0F9BFX0_9ZZZZ